jgi:hypothetical protein
VGSVRSNPLLPFRPLWTANVGDCVQRSSFFRQGQRRHSRVAGAGRGARCHLRARLRGQRLTDAYVAAFRIPNLLRDLFAEGALSSAFVPTFSDALNKGGRERAYRLGNLVLGGVLAVTGGLTLAGMVFSDQLVSLISRGFGGNLAQVALGGQFAQIMMPILALGQRQRGVDGHAERPAPLPGAGLCAGHVQRDQHSVRRGLDHRASVGSHRHDRVERRNHGLRTGAGGGATAQPVAPGLPSAAHAGRDLARFRRDPHRASDGAGHRGSGRGADQHLRQHAVRGSPGLRAR